MAEPQAFLPEAPEGPEDRFDIVLVTGDAYVDHPAFGAALLGRHLEGLGFRVGILAQPDWRAADDFRRFGRPRLFFGVTAGNLDSIVAHYTPDRRRRNRDAYSPGGQKGRRPDYASVVYAQRCREAFPDVAVVMGGIEASLRRLAHYDYVQDKVRRSVLIDAKADYLVYGMAEQTLAELAQALRAGDDREDIQRLPGLAYRTSTPPSGAEVLTLPAYEEAAADPEGFFRFFQALDQASLQVEVPALVQPHDGQAVVVNPPAKPLTPAQLDRLYELPFLRDFPDRYAAEGGIPALEPVRFSVVTHRGCYGGCSFCAITAHQGKGIVSRTEASILREVRRLVRHPLFRGTIQDVGGPTANMYGTGCTKADPGCSYCERASCLTPNVCVLLDASGSRLLELLRKIRRVPGVKHAFVASGLRHDLLMLPGQRRLFRELLQHHVGGQLKVAPEHIASRTLKLMGKPYARKYREFQELFEALRAEVGRPLYLIPYLMTGHPGSDLRDALDLAFYVKDLGRFVEQVQDFTPTPMTRSACMYHSGRDPATGAPVLVPKGREKSVHRALVQYRNPRNREYLIQYLEEAGRPDVLRRLYGTHYRRQAKGPPTGRTARRRPGDQGGKSAAPRGRRPQKPRP